MSATPISVQGPGVEGAGCNTRAPVAPSLDERRVPTAVATPQHSATPPAWLADLRRISELHEELANATRALAANLEVAVAAVAEQSVHAEVPEAPVLDDLLSTKQLCDLLHLTSRTVRRMELQDELPAPIRTGRRKNWRRETIDAWLAERERDAG